MAPNNVPFFNGSNAQTRSTHRSHPYRTVPAPIRHNGVASINRNVIRNNRFGNNPNSIRRVQQRHSQYQDAPQPQRIKCLPGENSTAVDNKITELLVYGNFLGRLIEAFPKDTRTNAVRDIECAEFHFCQKIRNSYILQPVLGAKLLEIEQSRQVAAYNPLPGFIKKKGSSAYGTTVESYLASIPSKLRGGILLEISNIVEKYGMKVGI